MAPNPRSGSIRVNILGAGQEDVCRAFSSKTGSKYENIPWHPSASGAPFLEQAVAWLDLPLLFFQGGYG